MEDSTLQSTQSGAFIGSHDDLLTEILLRLPATSILRFKSVSKHWRWLLCHRHFTQRYDNLSKSHGLFSGGIYIPFDVENPITPSFPSLELYFDRSGVRIVQSCNGLLLCSSNRKNGVCKYYVLNPTTKQLALIPPVPGGRKVEKSIRFMGLAFHQTDCVHYKVVCIRSLEICDKLFQIQVYSSDTRKWKICIQSVSAFFKPRFNPLFRNGVYWNRAVYWAPLICNSNYFYFRLDIGQLQTLPLPVGWMSSEIVAMYFGESRGHLHLIAYKHHQHNDLHLNVYEMLSDHSGWFVKYQLQLDELLGAFPEMVCAHGYGYRVIDVVRGQEEEDTFMVLKFPDKMITYNVHDKSFKQIYSFTRHSDYSINSYHRYTKTLSSF